MFYSHAKMELRKLLHSKAFKSPLKYVSWYEMPWKLAFMVYQHIIEFLVENNY
jgi:hypothetical protein